MKENFDKNSLLKAIEKDSKSELKIWLEKNKANLSPKTLDSACFLGNSPYLQIPIFAAIFMKKYNAFVFLIEDAKIDILARDASGRTILDALCDSKWINGLNYIVDNHRDLIKRIKEKYGMQNLKLLRNLALGMSKNYSDNLTSLLFIDRLLELENSDLLISMEIGNQKQTFVEKILDNKTKQAAEKLVEKHGFNLPTTSLLMSGQSKISPIEEASQQHELTSTSLWGKSNYSFFSSLWTIMSQDWGKSDSVDNANNSAILTNEVKNTEMLIGSSNTIKAGNSHTGDIFSVNNSGIRQRKKTTKPEERALLAPPIDHVGIYDSRKPNLDRRIGDKLETILNYLEQNRKYKLFNKREKILAVLKVIFYKEEKKCDWNEIPHELLRNRDGESIKLSSVYYYYNMFNKAGELDHIREIIQEEAKSISSNNSSFFKPFNGNNASDQETKNGLRND